MTMKKIKLTAILILMMSPVLLTVSTTKQAKEQPQSQPQSSDWENPGMIGRNKEAPHCPIIPFDLVKRDLVTLNLDYKQMGVGGDTSWGDRARPHPEYTLPVKEYSYSFRLRPLSSREGNVLELSKQRFD